MRSATINSRSQLFNKKLSGGTSLPNILRNLCLYKIYVKLFVVMPQLICFHVTQKPQYIVESGSFTLFRRMEQVTISVASAPSTITIPPIVLSNYSVR
jgi:hypothetical protein